MAIFVNSLLPQRSPVLTLANNANHHLNLIVVGLVGTAAHIVNSEQECRIGSLSKINHAGIEHSGMAAVFAMTRCVAVCAVGVRSQELTVLVDAPACVAHGAADVLNA